MKIFFIADMHFGDDNIRKYENRPFDTVDEMNEALIRLKQSTIDNIIHGASKNPKIRTLHKIAVVFGMTISEFLDFPELNDYSIDDEDEE